MGGLKNFFFRIVPLITLICMICFGISYLFNIENLTYLETKTIGNETIHTFNLSLYIRNLDINILKRAVSNVVDTETFIDIFEAWQTLWDDGYDFGDIFWSIVNGFIMVIDVILLIINIAIIPFRIIAGLLLTGMSLIGINISNENSTILTALNTILDVATIPLIRAIGVPEPPPVEPETTSQALIIIQNIMQTYAI